MVQPMGFREVVGCFARLHLVKALLRLYHCLVEKTAKNRSCLMDGAKRDG